MFGAKNKTTVPAQAIEQALSSALMGQFRWRDTARSGSVGRLGLRVAGQLPCNPPSPYALIRMPPRRVLRR
jgi:hypothetical protein